MTALLEVKGLEVAYGHIEAVKGIDIELRDGEIAALVGANGAGKSTTLLALSGLVRIKAGSIRFSGEEIGGLAPHRIVRRGLVQVAEGRATLTTMSVRENLALGAYTRRDRHKISADLDGVLQRFPVLATRLDQVAGTLSGGEQQMLAIGRALMARPRLLLLDEPSMGLAPIVVQRIFATLKQMNEDGLPMLLVEQNVRQALKIARRGYVLETGRVALADTSENLLRDTRVVDAYLGTLRVRTVA
jgi:branched-chain amino acid transport system ATP-binding protein